MGRKEFLRTVCTAGLLVVTVFILSPAVVMAYGGGGGNDGPGNNSGIGATVSSTAVQSYFSWSDGITDHASLEAAVTEANEAEKAEEGPYGYTDRYTERYYERVHMGLAVSQTAWDETIDVLPSVRRFAVVLEQMIMAGAIQPQQAFNLLAVYNLARQRQLRR